MSGYELRPINPDDLEIICRHRHEMFKVSGRTDEMVAPMTEHFRPWLKPMLEDGRYFGWFITSTGRVLAGMGMMVIDWRNRLTKSNIGTWFSSLRAQRSNPSFEMRQTRWVASLRSQ